MNVDGRSKVGRADDDRVRADSLGADSTDRVGGDRGVVLVGSRKTRVVVTIVAVLGKTNKKKNEISFLWLSKTEGHDERRTEGAGDPLPLLPLPFPPLLSPSVAGAGEGEGEDSGAG